MVFIDHKPEEVYKQAAKGLCDLVWKNGIFLALTVAHLINVLMPPKLGFFHDYSPCCAARDL